jgi:hypothetical protein
MNIFILKNNREEYLFEIDEWRDPHFHHNIKNAKFYTDEQEVKNDKRYYSSSEPLEIIEFVAIRKELIPSFVDKIDLISNEIQQTLE